MNTETLTTIAADLASAAQVAELIGMQLPPGNAQLQSVVLMLARDLQRQADVLLEVIR